jgi:hypothetical protein
MLHAGRSWVRIPMGSVIFPQCTESLQSHYGSGVYSAFNKNEYRKISGGKARTACKDGNLTTIYEPTLRHRKTRPVKEIVLLLFCCIVSNVSFIVRVALCAVFCLGVVLLYVICAFLGVVSYYSTTAKSKIPFAVQLNNNNNTHVSLRIAVFSFLRVLESIINHK